MDKEATPRKYSSVALKGKTFAVFTGGGGMRVDLQRYFASEAGRDARKSIAESGAVYFSAKHEVTPVE